MQGLEVKRRDNPLFASQAMEGLLDKMLLEGASNAELVAYARAQMDLLLTNQIPAERLVMSKNISRPLSRYKNQKEHHVIVARALIKAGVAVVPGDRVELLYVCSHSREASDKVIPFQLHREEPIDFAHYVRFLSEPFSRALAEVLAPEELAHLWDLQSYDRLVPSATSGGGPMRRYMTHMDPRVYTLKRALHTDMPSCAPRTKITRFFAA